MYVKVSVMPGAKKERIIVHKNGSLTVSVREPARQNLANRRVLELVARHFHTRTTNCTILTGHHSPKKLISVAN